MTYIDPDFAETPYNLGSPYEDLRNFKRVRILHKAMSELIDEIDSTFT